MRIHLPILGLLAALGLCACGELANAPLRQGVVRGQVDGPIGEGALALVRERTQLRTELDTEGGFELREVPSGQVELYLVGGPDRALRHLVEVPPGRVVELGTLTLLSAARLGVEVRVDDATSPQGARVSVQGTPFQAVETDTFGRTELTPLPPGCYFVRAELPGVASDVEEVCLEPGETELLEIDLEVEDDELDCALRGCEDGKVCNASGRCVECVDTTQCAPGLTCENELCVGQLPACGTCTRNEQCGVSGRCEFNEDRGACLYPCDGGGGCAEPSFACESGWCVPARDKFEHCAATEAVGISCESAEVCKDQGLVDGLCVEGRCTVACGQGELCPGGQACAERAGLWVCP